jgi:hypothetical protein
MMKYMRTRARAWLAIAVLAALPTLGNASEVSPEELATLGMRLILQQDDESFVRFHTLVTGSTEEEVRDEYLSKYREKLDDIMAAAVEEAKGGRAIYKVITEAQRRITCTPVLPGRPVKRNADGTEHVVVRIRCMVPEIRHIAESARPDPREGELVQDTNRSWRSYLEDLQRPATVPIHFTWTLLRDPRAKASGWKPYDYVFENNMMTAGWALSPQSRPEGTANYINAIADAAAVDDEVDPWDAEDE